MHSINNAKRNLQEKPITIEETDQREKQFDP
jgi:hypothetical protein